MVLIGLEEKPKEGRKKIPLNGMWRKQRSVFSSS
jgi:hypothetical protein